MTIKLDHVNITVGNLAESISWYQKIFGFKLVESGTNAYGRKWGIVEADDSMICMTEWPARTAADRDEHDSAHRLYHFGIRIADPEKWRAILKEHSLKLYYGGEVAYPRSRSWYIHDPSGHEIEVSYAEGKMFS